jgi:hypothetical protein
MKKLICLVTLLLFIHILAFGQEGFDNTYDKFKDTTTVTSPTMQLFGTLTNGLQLKLIGVYEGQKPTQPKETGIMLFSVADERQFRDDTELIFLINDERLKLGKMQIAMRDYKSGRYMEGLYLAVTLETIKRLADGKTVEAKVGSKEFRITAGQQDILKAFIRRFDNPKI